VRQGALLARLKGEPRPRGAARAMMLQLCGEPDLAYEKVELDLPGAAQPAHKKNRLVNKPTYKHFTIIVQKLAPASPRRLSHGREL
jgi:hypothetical protein